MSGSVLGRLSREARCWSRIGRGEGCGERITTSSFLWRSQSESRSSRVRALHVCARSKPPCRTIVQSAAAAAAIGSRCWMLRQHRLLSSGYGSPANDYSMYIPTEVKVVSNLSDADYDGIVLVSSVEPGNFQLEPFKSVVATASKIDAAIYQEGAVLPINLPAGRLIYSPTGPINCDYNDVRVYAQAAAKGIKRALKAGVRSPLLVLLPSSSSFETVDLVTLLGALEALYVPLEIREIGPERTHKATRLGVWSPLDIEKLESLVKRATVLESGRYVARDLGQSDPERMAPPRFEEYVKELFANTRIGIQVISDLEIIDKEYPLFAAVNRGASVIPRHAGRIIFLTYEPQDPSAVEKTIMLVGKGVTYDTGGADIKINQAMAGMSRDKCGAAAAAGFMQTVNLLQPQKIKVVAALGVVRNSCGENSYVSDEVVTARSGARVRVTNTDAEGRMIMADILYHIKEMALHSVNPHIFTIATLTGHAILSAGSGFSIAIDNSVARKEANAYELQSRGEALGDMFEVSVLRKVDFEFHKGTIEGDDVIQSGKKSTQIERGHQGPAAFLVMASGLDKHEASSKEPLRYCHLDIAASAGDFPNNTTGAPIPTLTERFIPYLYN